MYCPRCGQQQISEEMRFCSRCGLPMSGLAEWVAGGGTPVALAASGTQVPVRSRRRKGIRRGAKLMFLSAVLFPIFLVISLAVDEGGAMIVPIILFFVSLIIMLYSRLFIEDIPTMPSQQAQLSSPAPIAERGALPPASSNPIYAAPQQVRTNELARPPSVTEHTTKLLDKD